MKQCNPEKKSKISNGAGNKTMKKGVTLIELLVIIAIIGVLLGVLLVASGPVRNKSKNTRIQSDLLQIQNLAEHFYLDEGDYDSLDTASEITDLENDIIAQGSSLTITKPDPSAYEYCTHASLISNPDTFFCVDAQGNALETPYPTATCNYLRGLFYCLPCLDMDDDGDFDEDDVWMIFCPAFESTSIDPPGCKSCSATCVSLGFSCCGVWNAAADIDQDNDVDIDDVTLFGGYMNTSCP